MADLAWVLIAVLNGALLGAAGTYWFIARRLDPSVLDYALEQSRRQHPTDR